MESSSPTTDAVIAALESQGWRVTDASGRDPSDPIRMEHPQHGAAWVAVDAEEADTAR
jgi:hypothetical protein